nr:pyrimidine/purine nucleoside phosphorylase [uncultured Trichococcus sp.]
MEFKNVTVIKEANVYFDGKVTSRTVLFESGEKKTLGFMLTGDYEFNTDAEETMEVLGGEMSVLLPGEVAYRLYTKGESYIVPANSSFKMTVDKYVDYCCSYKN